MDVQHRRVVRAGRAITLSPREFDVLQLLMQEQGASFRAPSSASASGSAITKSTRTVERYSSPGCRKVDAGFDLADPYAPAHRLQYPRPAPVLRLFHVAAAVASLLLLYGTTAGWDEARADAQSGLVKAAPDGVRRHRRQRYEIVANLPGILSTNPPVAVVYLEGNFPPVNPPATPSIKQKDLTLVPALLPVQTGSRVEFPNADDTYHNIFSYSPAKRFDLGRYRADESPVPSVLFDTAGLVVLRCDIHDHMRALIVVLATLISS